MREAAARDVGALAVRLLRVRSVQLASAYAMRADAVAAEAAASGAVEMAKSAERAYNAEAHAYRQENAMAGLLNALQVTVCNGTYRSTRCSSPNFTLMATLTVTVTVTVPVTMTATALVSLERYTDGCLHAPQWLAMHAAGPEERRLGEQPEVIARLLLLERARPPLQALHLE